MPTRNITHQDVIDRWLGAGQTARISGLDFTPLAHPILPDTAQRIVKGQAAGYLLRQHPQGNVWFLKKFAPSRRPSDAYLQAVDRCLPGGVEFFTCTQRRLITANHVDHRYSAYKAAEFLSWIEGTILMPKVPGSPWSSVADSLREGESTLTLEQRLTAGMNLAECIDRLEAGGCCHRDLSASNVFVDQDGRIYLIDWDSLCHPNLPFQANTTVGTAGYIAPFTRAASGAWDASCSWRPYADRYALAILIAEILLTGAGRAPAQEDGTMFAQKQLEDPDNGLTKERIDDLWRLDRAAGQLLWKALHASSFGTCPPPAQWRCVLRKALRGQQPPTDRVGSWNRGSRRACSSCGAKTWVTDTWYAQLHSRGVPFLCKACRDARRLQRDQTHPAVTCEHCRRSTRMSRGKLDALRAKGSPVLCPLCLRAQLDQWKREQSAWGREHPEVHCSDCGTRFRIRRDQRDALATRGRPPLCRECLRSPARNRPARPSPAPRGIMARFLSRFT